MPWEARGLRGRSREAGRFSLSVSSGKMFNVRRKNYQSTAGR